MPIQSGQSRSLGDEDEDEVDALPLADINVTPLIDVMLVLLIIFMVTAPLMMAGVPLHLPKSSATLQGVARRVEWIGTPLRDKGLSILRSKGILDIKGSPNRFIFQGVHMLMEGDDGKAWGRNEARASKLVFIGRGLDATELKAGFAACVA